MKTFILVIILLAVSPLIIFAADLNTPAFPGAEGFGAMVQGGRGGKLLFVDTLEDYDPETQAPVAGSFRAACDANGRRTILFRVSGTIELEAPILITEPFLTIAGQSAPGDGICIKNYGVSIKTYQVIVRYLRCRPGDVIGKKRAEQGQPWSTDALSIGWGEASQVIFDHCSAGWASDEVMSVSGPDITDVTIQWCIISESLNISTHKKGPHGYGSLLCSNGKISYHHNLIAFHRSRSPRPGVKGDGIPLIDIRNNLMYKGGRGYTVETEPVRMNFIGNYHPDTPFKATANCYFYAKDNIGQVYNGEPREQPYSVAHVTTTSPERAREEILKNAGATLPVRDKVDQRVVDWVIAGKGGIIDSQQQVGGWPVLHSTTPPPDSDNDGMPDEWEIRHQFDAETANHNNDPDHDGYTNIEEYLNQTNPLEQNE
jgi:hypothetical protein